MAIAPQAEKTVLILDDEPNFNTLLRELFGTTPHKVVAEQDPKVALSLIKERHVDLVVTDQQMPGLTGAEFIRQARAHRPDLLFIMVSGRLDAAVTREMIDAGIGGIFLKPVDIKALLQCASSLLESEGKGIKRTGADLARFN